jgi:hypothetical protein
MENHLHGLTSVYAAGYVAILLLELVRRRKRVTP